MLAPWMILMPGDEGNYTGAILVADRAEYVKYLAGTVGSFTFRQFTSAEEAWDNCNYRNRGWQGNPSDV